MKMTKENILAHTNGGLDFYAHVMGRKGLTLKPDKNAGLKNPFYDDRNGSLSIYREKDQYLFNDFGDPLYKGDVFQFAALHYGLDCQNDFMRILENISRDLHLNLGQWQKVKNGVHTLPKTKPKLPETTPARITEGGTLDYWLNFGDRERIAETMQRYKVKSLLSYTAINQKDKPFTVYAQADNPIFGFKISSHCYKIYRPFEKDGYKHLWLGEKPGEYNNIFGIDQLSAYNETILIVEGLKDCLVANANGFAAVGLDNANTRMDSDMIRLLQSRCKYLIVCLDNDEAGSKAGKELCSLYGLPELILPQQYGKDLGDFFYKADRGRLQLLNEFIQSAIGQPLPEPIEPQNDFEKVLHSKRFLQRLITKTVTFANPVITQNGNGIIHPNTINVIQGKAGVHKSRLVESLCSCLLTNDPSVNFLGYKKQLTNFNSYSVLYVDTERNLKDQYVYALQQIKLKAGFPIDSELPNFDFISLIDVSRDQRFEVLKQYLEHVRGKFHNHIFIVLDVLTDCIANFNDVKESLRLIDLLNVMINRYDVTFLCVIHENPADGSSKARGHLGTEIMNKASCQVQIGFEKDRGHNDTDLIKVKYLKVRVGKKPEPFYLQYSEEAKGLVLADFSTVSEIMDCKKNKADLTDVKTKLGSLLIQPMERQQLINELMIAFDCGQRTIEDRLKAIIDQQEIISNANNRDCLLSKKPIGRKTHYCLQPFEGRQQNLADDLPF